MQEPEKKEVRKRKKRVPGKPIRDTRYELKMTSADYKLLTKQARQNRVTKAEWIIRLINQKAINE